MDERRIPKKLDVDVYMYQKNRKIKKVLILLIILMDEVGGFLCRIRHNTSAIH